MVPTGTNPLVPSPICHSIRPRKAFSSTEPFLNGVTSAVKEPRKLVLAVMTRFLYGANGLAHPYRFARGDERLKAVSGCGDTLPCFCPARRLIVAAAVSRVLLRANIGLMGAGPPLVDSGREPNREQRL